MSLVQIKDILVASKLHPSKIKCVYTFGSRVYSTHNDNSDWDFVVVANTPDTNKEIKFSNLNLHIMTSAHFLQHLKEHHSFAIECFYSPNEYRLLELIKFNWSPNKKSLIHSFTHISNCSWDSFQKKFTEDHYKSIKDVFHSIRVPLFGLQIINSGKIENFSESNYILQKLINNSYTKLEIIEKFTSYRQSILERLQNS